MRKILFLIVIILLLGSLALGGLAFPLTGGRWGCLAWPWCNPLQVIASEYALIGQRNSRVDTDQLVIVINGEEQHIKRSDIVVWGGSNAAPSK